MFFLTAASAPLLNWLSFHFRRNQRWIRCQFRECFVQERSSDRGFRSSVHCSRACRWQGHKPIRHHCEVVRWHNRSTIPFVGHPNGATCIVLIAWWWSLVVVIERRILEFFRT